jgi:predicted acetyltransferase
MILTLRELTAADEKAFLAGMNDWAGEDPHWHSFAWREGMTYREMLVILEDERTGRNLQAGRVAHTMLYAFVDGAIVGRLSVRHSLNEALRKRGGHIGYAVAQPFRRKGYATEIARQGVEFCKKLGLSTIMITCADSNVPSWKVIERLGGKLQDKVFDETDKETIRRYWLALN